MSCYETLIASLANRKLLDRIPEQDLREAADILQRYKDAGLPADQYAAKVKDTLKTLYTEYAEKRAIEAKHIMSIQIELDKKLQDVGFGKDMVKRVDNILRAGNAKAAYGGNYRTDSVARQNVGSLMKKWIDLVMPFAKDVQSGALDKETARAIAIRDAGGISKPSDISESAWKYSEAIRAMNEFRYSMASAFTPYIDKAENYFWSRRHDPVRIQAAGEAKWTELAKQTYKDSFPEASPQQLDKIFSAIYKQITDDSFGTPQAMEQLGKLAFPGTREGSVMKRMAISRTLKATDPELIAEYNKQFGYGTIDDAVRASIRKVGKDVAVLQQWGPKPEAMFDWMMERAQELGSKGEARALLNEQSNLNGKFRQTLGYGNNPARTGFGKGVEWTQNRMNDAVLGLSSLRIFPSLSGGAGLISGLNGKPVALNAFELAVGMVKNLRPGEREAFLKEANLIGQTTLSAFDQEIGSAPTGILSKVRGVSDALNMIHAYVSWQRSGVVKTAMRALGEAADKPHAEAGKYLQEQLGRYTLTEHEWNAIRQSAQDVKIGKDTHRIISPNTVETLSDAQIKAFYIESGAAKPGEEIHPDFINKARYSMATKIGAMMNDYADYGTHSPGQAEKLFMYGGSTPDSGSGIARRLFWHLKSFFLTQFNTYKRIYYSGNGAAGGAGAIAQAVPIGMFLWVLGDVLHQLAQGKKPEDPLTWKYGAKAFIGSGAGSLVSEMALNLQEHKYFEAMGRMMGPIPSTVAQIGGGALQAATAKSQKERGRAEVQMISGAQNLMPFGSSLGIGPLIIHPAFDALKNFASPDYTEKRDRQLQKHGQERYF